MLDESEGGHLARTVGEEEDPEDDGHLDGPAVAGGPRRKVQLEVTSRGHFAFHQFPLENLRCTADIENDTVDLPKIEAGFAGGTAAGHARLIGRAENGRLAFDATLRGANLGRVIDTIDDYQSARKTSAPDRPRKRWIENAASCELDLDLKAEGRPQDFLSYRGEGSFRVHGAELVEIPMLNRLFEVLSVSLLTPLSQRLDTAQSNFNVEGRRLVFPKLEITGPNAAIEVGGEYLLDAKTLDFTVQFTPFRKRHFYLTTVLGMALSPLLSTLEMRLTGPLANPSWNLTFLRSLKPERSPSPPAPAGAAQEEPSKLQLVPEDAAGAPLPAGSTPPGGTAPSASPPAAPAPAKPGDREPSAGPTPTAPKPPA